MAKTKKGCFTKRDVQRLGRTLEDTMVIQIQVIQDTIEETKSKSKRKDLDKIQSETYTRFQDLFIKVKYNMCNPPDSFTDKWIDQFRKGAVPWV